MRNVKVCWYVLVFKALQSAVYRGRGNYLKAYRDISWLRYIFAVFVLCPTEKRAGREGPPVPARP
jgi:hypothetical protein